MAVFSTSNTLAGTQQAMTTTYKTLLSLTAQTTGLTRALVQEFDLGADGTPADNVLTYDVSRVTTIGTGTNAVPVALDTTWRAASTVGTVNNTAEPTVTATSSVFSLPLNQRTSFRWIASPGSELVIPAVNLAGFAIRAKSPLYTSTAVATAMHSE